MSPVQGLVRLRKHQFGRQAAFGTKVAATRAYALKGVPDVELNWTDPEVDLGSLDPIAAPRREAPDLTASLDIPQLDYNMLPLLLSHFFGGGVEPTGGGTAQTWTYSPASTTVDEPDVSSYEFGDDVASDWFQFGDGILESVELTGPEGLGPVTGSASWRFGSVASTGSTDSPVTGTVPTPGLTVETNPALVYLKDAAIYIADTTAGLAAGQIVDALHTITIRLSGDLDMKRYANGAQVFDVDAYARATRAIEIEATYAKTADTVGTGSESDSWMSDQAVERFLRLTFTSTAMAEGVTPYSWTTTIPARYYTRVESESGGNSTIVLTARAFYDANDLSGVFESVVVNTLTAAELGLAGS